MFVSVVICSLVLLFNFSCSMDQGYSNHHFRVNWQLAHHSLKEKIIIKGLIFGQKPRQKNLKAAISHLHIHHLFTPSGLHLSSILWFFSFFSLRRVALFIFFPLVILTEGLFAFKRVYFIRLASELLLMKGCAISSHYLFLGIFAIEFIFRAYLNPLSFTYSFLFLGIIYSLRKSSPLVLLVGLWFGQALIASFSGPSLHLFSFPLNSFLTLVVSLFYPIVILSAVVPLGLCDYLYDLILFCGNSLLLLNLKVGAIHAALIFAMILMRRLQKWIIVFLIFISSEIY